MWLWIFPLFYSYSHAQLIWRKDPLRNSSSSCSKASLSNIHSSFSHLVWKGVLPFQSLLILIEAPDIALAPGSRATTCCMRHTAQWETLRSVILKWVISVHLLVLPGFQLHYIIAILNMALELNGFIVSFPDAKYFSQCAVPSNTIISCIVASLKRWNHCLVISSIVHLSKVFSPYFAGIRSAGGMKGNGLHF